MATSGLELSTIWDNTESLVSDLEQMLKTTKCADVLFVVGKYRSEYKVHSFLLMARCFNFENDNAPIYKQNWCAEVFENVLRYIYTGKIELSSINALETLRIAMELNIPKLILKCEECFLKELTVENCCDFYMNAINLKESSSYGDLVNRSCQSFIEENATEIVQTRGFLNLSKDALTQLISRDKFSLAEEDVWRAVLRWSKHHAEVELPVEYWTDYDRENVCKYLSDLVCHVRLLLVDSKVFAEEVEPTGVVPMEMSLERYRYAAIPQKFNKYDDIRLRPRVHSKMFHGTTILWKNNSKYQSTVNNWLNNVHQEWQLIYKATRDGFGSETFHEKCDDYPKTLSIVQGSNGCICGGFTDVPWRYDNDNGQYSQSSSCFLFILANSQDILPTRFDIIRPKYAILSHTSLGPTFGAGPDLSIAGDCNVNSESCSRLSHSYGGDHRSPASLMGAREFKVADYEVFVPKTS